MNELIKQLNPEYEINNCKYNDSKIIVSIYSSIDTAVCPHCGIKSFM